MLLSAERPTFSSTGRDRGHACGDGAAATHRAAHSPVVCSGRRAPSDLSAESGGRLQNRTGEPATAHQPPRRHPLRVEPSENYPLALAPQGGVVTRIILAVPSCPYHLICAGVPQNQNKVHSSADRTAMPPAASLPGPDITSGPHPAARSPPPPRISPSSPRTFQICLPSFGAPLSRGPSCASLQIAVVHVPAVGGSLRRVVAKTLRTQGGVWRTLPRQYRHLSVLAVQAIGQRRRTGGSPSKN